MKRLDSFMTAAAIAIALSITSAAGPQAPAQKSAGQSGDGWVSLFDGKSLNGWRSYKKENATDSRWKVENGTLTLPPNDGKDTHGARDIVSADTYDHFDLTWEWKIAPGGNSGLKYFVLEDRDSAIGHEYQLIDDEQHPDAKVGAKRQTASLYDVLAPANRKLKPAGEWNSSRIVVRGNTVEHYLNDGRVLTYELGSPALNTAIQASKFKDVARFGKLQKGHILLQDHGNQVWFRNIKIRRLPTT